jgi:hypothetical protein
MQQNQPNPQQQQAPPTREVIVKDVDISFGQMVVLLVKLAIASIPAAIILWIVFAFFAGVMMAVTGGLGAIMGG